MSNVLTIVSEDIYASRDSFESALVDRNISFEREAGFAMQILGGNSYTAGVAASNRQSMVSAIVNVAAMGISLNPAKRQAYLVPRDGKVCLDISWMGLIDLAVQCGSILWAQAQVVYESESLTINGYDKAPSHVRNPFAKARGEIVGAYCVAKLATGDYLTETMTIDELTSIRGRSEAWKSGQKGPWKSDFAEMCRKTVVKRSSKYWPRVTSDERLGAAINHLNTDGEEGISTAQPAVEVAQSRLEQIRRCNTMPELNALYGAAMGEFAAARDGAGARAFQDAAKIRRAELKESNTIDMEGPSK